MVDVPESVVCGGRILGVDEKFAFAVIVSGAEESFGVFRITDDELVLGLGGADAMEIDRSVDVGVGECCAGFWFGESEVVETGAVGVHASYAEF